LVAVAVAQREQHLAAVPLAADVGRVAVSTISTVSVLFWYMGLIPDLAVMRDRARTKLRKFAYGLFALG